jgi:transposase-like protein
METTKSKFARLYDGEFKENAVALVRSGKTVTDVARDLGVSHWSLARWVQLGEGGGSQTQVGTLDTESPQEREMRRMRHEIDSLRRQRDILKKALGIDSAAPRPFGAVLTDSLSRFARLYRPKWPPAI